MKKYPAHVLIIQPPAKNKRDTLIHFLEEQQEFHEFSRVASINDISADLTAEKLDLIILDYSFWAENALQIQQKFPDVPILLIADQGDEQMVAEIAPQGFTDVIFRDQNNNFHHLLPMVIDKIRRNRQVAEECDLLRLRLAEQERALIQTPQHRDGHNVPEEVFRRLADSVAHDLSNMISPILGFGKILLDDADKDDPNLELIAEIINSARRAKALVRQLSIFKEKEAKEFIPIDFVELLENLQSTLQRTLAENNLVEMSFAKPLPMIKGDTALLEQAIMGLFLHLQETMEEAGTINLSVQHWKIEEHVSDDQGIGPGTFLQLKATNSVRRAPLLEPFSVNTEDGTKQRLALVTAIVKQHGGHIAVDEDKPPGWDIYLPALEEPAIIPAPSAIKNQAGECSETILVLDRDKQIQELIAIFLREKGYTVFTAEHEEVPVKLLETQEQKIELLLVDLAIIESEREIIGQLQSCQARPFKVLYLAPQGQSEIEGELAAHLIHRPFSLNTLADKVRNVLDQDH